MLPIKKIDILRDLMKSEKWREAMSLAAKFPSLGAEKEVITRAHGCYTNPHFYKSIRIDTDAAIQAGIDALKIKYTLRADVPE